MKVFFELGDRQQLLPNRHFSLCSNNLDSTNYVLERVSHSRFNRDLYYLEDDVNLIRYHNCWTEDETVLKEVAEQPRSKKKAGTMLFDLMSKKSKNKKDKETNE